MNRLTKYNHFMGLKHPFDAFFVAMVFIQEIIRLHGFPASIIEFFWAHFRRSCSSYGTELKRSTTYHPHTNGQTEVVNKGFETYLWCFVKMKLKSWAKSLPWAEFLYKTAPHCSTKVSSFKALYGRDLPHEELIEGKPQWTSWRKC